MVRLYHQAPAREPLHPRNYGPLNRFDPHIRDRHQRPREQLDGRGVLYLAENLGCALAEGLLGQVPEVAICPGRYLLMASPGRSLRLLDLTGDGAMKIGALTTLGSGDESRRLTQAWGRAIYEDLSRFDGVRYRGAHQGGLCHVLWDRAGDLTSHPGTGIPGDQLVEPAMLDRVRVALAAQGRYPVVISESECPECAASAP